MILLKLIVYFVNSKRSLDDYVIRNKTFSSQKKVHYKSLCFIYCKNLKCFGYLLF